ncbi:aurora kinase A-interacting protein [Micropterus dolomieu]|uniref:aurora kinase A-interacting protein n=1 Tax=Micropterus dolomieu TaxID=147949 RepID=UPI001E8E5DEA|nr:aurora kinase A-interacting protein [Micropterus dolomieu]XP_045912525.1 aurora kinase A-interacting protein [Micropterus dolomieu]XP_045912526.1 aurora kinase A-interacting protein [Micropterus dolomieu]
MLTSKVIPRLSVLRRASCALQAHGEIFNGRVHPVLPAYCSLLKQKLRNYSTAADNTSPPRWVQLEPELDEALVPRKLSVSPLESWLSLRYSLPPLLESAQPHEDAGLLEEKLLPPISVPVLEDGEGSAAPLNCKNVLEIRRRKMNRHKYKKLQKRTKFLRRRVLEGRGKKKQKRFEEDLKRIWTRAGLKKAPEGWNAPKIFIKQHGNKRD